MYIFGILKTVLMHIISYKVITYLHVHLFFEMFIRKRKFQIVEGSTVYWNTTWLLKRPLNVCSRNLFKLAHSQQGRSDQDRTITSSTFYYAATRAACCYVRHNRSKLYSVYSRCSELTAGQKKLKSPSQKTREIIMVKPNKSISRKKKYQYFP